MKLRYALCASAALSGLLITPAFAQDDVAEDTGAENNEIIVTAVR